MLSGSPAAYHRAMILGTGIDMTEIADMARRLERATILGAFSETERAYADARPKHRAQILAARWAAKEAFGKALGTGLKQGWVGELAGIEVIHDESGRPAFRLSPFFAAMIPGDARVHLSLSHTPAAAIAMVVIEGP